LSVSGLVRINRDGEPVNEIFTTFAMTAKKEDDGSQPLAGPSQPLSTNSPPPSSSSDNEHASSSSPMPTPHRSELLDRARHFLSSPQVIHQDHESKRRFLSEKGLSDGEVQLLLREMVRASCLFVSASLHTTERPTHNVCPSLPSSEKKQIAFALAHRSTTDVSRASSIPFARSSRGHVQGAFMASGRFHCPALHLLRT